MAYIFLFLSAFGAATLLPLQSESVLAGMLILGEYSPVLLIGVATLGNVLGYQLMPKLVVALLVIFAGVSIYTPLAHPVIAERWFSLPQLFYFSPVPILVLLLSFLVIRACKQRHEFAPLMYMFGLVFLAYTGFLISLFPYIIPPSVTIWDAAAPYQSQLFSLIGALILIPIIITYTAMSYWVFRDKVKVGDGYH